MTNDSIHVIATMLAVATVTSGFRRQAQDPAATALVERALAVRYAQDAKLELMVPIDVKERYWRPHKPNDDRLEVDSTYTNFRRFQVTVGEQIKTPH